MSNFLREGSLFQDLSGYWADLTTTYKEGIIVGEQRVFCQTKEGAEETINKFILGEYDG